MRNIYLVGMPGSGKSTLGRRIADIMRRKFMDTDEVITVKTEETPEQIISLHGEEKLRELEKTLMDELLDTTGLIVSTGGGFPVFNENMKHMNEHGITVYLRYDAIDLWKRLEHDRVRPLSSSLESTKNLLDSRERVYGEAQIIILCDDDLLSNVERILGAIRDGFSSEL